MKYFYYQNTMELQLIGFSYDKESANVVMWKDKECEYISSAWNKQQDNVIIIIILIIIIMTIIIIAKFM